MRDFAFSFEKKSLQNQKLEKRKKPVSERGMVVYSKKERKKLTRKDIVYVPDHFILNNPRRDDKRKKLVGYSLAALGVLAMGYCGKLVRDKQFEYDPKEFSYNSGHLLAEENKKQEPEPEIKPEEPADDRAKAPLQENIVRHPSEKAEKTIAKTEIYRPEVNIEETRDNKYQGAKTISEVLKNFSPEKIEISPAIVKATEEYWREQYRKPEARKSLEGALLRIGAWEPDLKKVFAENGLPQEFIYLAVAESNCNPKARSRSGAVGFYQFMESTGRKYGLKIHGKIDEREHPLKSGRACAKLLKALYDKTKDWDLVFSGYNWDFLWSYLGDCNQKMKKPDYNGFVEFAERDINDFKSQLLKSNEWDHVVRENERPEQIAKFYEISLKALMDANKGKIKENKGKLFVKKGEILRFPINRVEIKKKIYDNAMRSFKENLNYPWKVKAAMKATMETAKAKQYQEKTLAQADIRPDAIRKY